MMDPSSTGSKGDAKRAVLRDLSLQMRVRAERLRQVDQRTDITTRPVSGGRGHGPPVWERIQLPGHPQAQHKQLDFNATPHSGPQLQRTFDLASVSGPRARRVIPSATRPGRGRGDMSPSKRQRLGELRTRCLARKFLAIWQHKVYGRVLPYGAVRHRRRVLLSKVWKEWYSIYWSRRVEWRLTARADCHCNFRLMTLTFNAWREFMIGRRARKVVVNWAQRVWARRLLGDVFKAWREWTDGRLEKRQVATRGMTWQVARLRKWAWRRWRQEIQAGVERRRWEVVALHHYASTLKGQAWSRWRRANEERQDLRAKEALADGHRGRIVKGHVISAWMEYLRHRRRRGRQKAIGDAHRNTHLLRHSLVLWRHRLHRVEELAQFRDTVDQWERRARLRRIFVAWRMYIDIRKYEASQEVRAILHHNNTLKRKSLHSLSWYRHHRHHVSDLKLLGVKMKRRLTLQRAFRTWEGALEAVEEGRLRGKTGAARAHNRRSLLRRCLSGWVSWLGQRREMHRLRRIADDHFASRALPVCLEQWVAWVEERKVKKVRHLQADQYYRSSVLQVCWSRWQCQLDGRQEQRYLIRLAVLHDTKATQSRVLTQWRQAAEDKRMDRIHWEKAVQNDERRRRRRTFYGWREVALRGRRWCELGIRIEMLRSRRLLATAWSSWRKFTVNAALKSRRNAGAERHFMRALTRRVLIGWRAAAVHGREARKKADDMGAERRLVHLREAWTGWRQGLVVAREDTERRRRADAHWRVIAMRKVLLSWQMTTSERVAKRHQTADEVNAAREVLSRSVMLRAFTTWRHRRDGLVVSRLTEVQSRLHYEGRLVSRALLTWKDWMARKQRDRLLKRQADCFLEKRLLAGAWLEWRSEANKHGMALRWWWSGLVSKVFLSWREWAQHRRAERNRLEGAQGRWRDRLVVGAVRHWLAVADRVKCERAREAAQAQVEWTLRSHSLVWRCATHWRQWTVRRQSGVPRRHLAPLHPRPAPTPMPVPSREPFKSGVGPQERRRPQMPAFLRESLAREGLLSPGSLKWSVDPAIQESTSEEPPLPPNYFHQSEDTQDVTRLEKLANKESEDAEKSHELERTTLDTREEHSTAQAEEELRNGRYPGSPTPIDNKENIPDPKEELTTIRTKLRLFREEKKKLKQLRCDFSRMTALLATQEDSSDKDLVENLREEINAISQEIGHLSKTLVLEKAKCHQLAERASHIIATLSTETCDLE